MVRGATYSEINSWIADNKSWGEDASNVVYNSWSGHVIGIFA